MKKELLLRSLDHIHESLITMADMLFYAGDVEKGEWALELAEEVEEIIKQVWGEENVC